MKNKVFYLVAFLITLFSVSTKGIAQNIEHDPRYSDQSQVSDIYRLGVVGPYQGNLLERVELGLPQDNITMYSTDKFSYFSPEMQWNANFTSLGTNSLGNTRFQTLEGYRKAARVASYFDRYGPACWCWGGIQQTMWYFTGSDVSGGFNHEIVREVNDWYETVGAFENWDNVWVVSAQNMGADLTAGEMEFITGVRAWTPTLPPTGGVDPETPVTPPVQTVPEPATLVLFGVGALAIAGIRKLK